MSKLWCCFSFHFFRKNETKLANAVHEVKTSLEKIVVSLESLCFQGRSTRQDTLCVIKKSISEEKIEPIICSKQTYFQNI